MIPMFFSVCRRPEVDEMEMPKQDPVKVQIGPAKLASQAATQNKPVIQTTIEIQLEYLIYQMNPSSHRSCQAWPHGRFFFQRQSQDLQPPISG
jgi:hypothetical protein